METYAALRRIDEILRTNVLMVHHPLRQSAFIETLIRLDQLNHQANQNGQRISFTDDLRIFPGVQDITSAVREYRNAVCHIYADAHFIAPDGTPKRRGRKLKQGENYAKVTFSVIIGKSVLLQTPQFTIESEYADDVCYIFGAHRLYLKRHIIRNFFEARAILMPTFPDLY